jgi:hypothetical protein
MTGAPPWSAAARRRFGLLRLGAAIGGVEVFEMGSEFIGESVAPGRHGPKRRRAAALQGGCGYV